jgi:hypothetical protein
MFFFGELAFGMCIEVSAVAIQGEHQKHLGVQSR